jgi:RNA polymerase sigma-70 factor (ECF subfamily)
MKKSQKASNRGIYKYHESEDLVQEVFLKAYVNIKGFDSSRKFSSWLYRIAHNEFINAIKKKGREPLAFFDSDTLFPNPAIKENVGSEIDFVQIRDLLNRCLDRIDAKYREPLILFYFEDQDYQGISEIMRIPVSTVGVRLSRGKSMLKKIYESFDNERK